MPTHEFTAADCTWADLHFSDLGEAREHLDALIEARKSLQSMRRLKVFALSDAPDADIDRIDRGDCRTGESRGGAGGVSR